MEGMCAFILMVHYEKSFIVVTFSFVRGSRGCLRKIENFIQITKDAGVYIHTPLMDFELDDDDVYVYNF